MSHHARRSRLTRTPKARRVGLTILHDSVAPFDVTSGEATSFNPYAVGFDVALFVLLARKLLLKEKRIQSMRSVL